MAIDHGPWLYWGANTGPSLCKADVLTTTLWNHVLITPFKEIFAKHGLRPNHKHSALCGILKENGLLLQPIKWQDRHGFGIESCEDHWRWDALTSHILTTTVSPVALSVVKTAGVALITAVVSGVCKVLGSWAYSGCFFRMCCTILVWKITAKPKNNYWN